MDGMDRMDMKNLGELNQDSWPIKWMQLLILNVHWLDSPLWKKSCAKRWRSTWKNTWHRTSYILVYILMLWYIFPFGRICAIYFDLKVKWWSRSVMCHLDENLVLKLIVSMIGKTRMRCDRNEDENQRRQWPRKRKTIPSLKTNIFAPENGCME